MANIWGQDMRGMGGLGGYSSLIPAMNSNVYFPQTRSVQSSLIPPNTQAPSLAGTPSLLSGMTGSQYQTPPMTGQPSGLGAITSMPQLPPWYSPGGWGGRNQNQQNDPSYRDESWYAQELSKYAQQQGQRQPPMAGQARGQQQGDQTTSSVTYNNPWWNQGRYNIGGQGADMAMRRRPPQIGGGGVRRFDQQGGGFPWNTGGYAPGGSSPLNDSLWQALQQRGFGTIPGGAPEGWTAYQLANGNIEYKQPGGGNWYRYNPSMGWYNSANPAGGYSNVNPFANMTPGGANATTSAY